ncbi:tetratricopeptide repeat protein [Cupriavidus pauculus]|uniref:Uncharacterized protein n=1 Tax=Cupriavidus pauculus TaxID=82633 RepID=A0A2N5CDH5_9BURK|nr:hypothetical protein [Cupriavidus pauculus]PLQ00264.1 hypothetical protein CYJ10_11415 [Cupriavidus pauculus]
MKRVLWALAALFVATSAHADGEFFTDAEANCKLWNEVPRPGERIRWEGKCQDGYGHGDGKLTYLQTDGTSSTSAGYFRHGKVFGKYETRRYDASGSLQYPIKIRFSSGSEGPAETYEKAIQDSGGFSIAYFSGKRRLGIYRSNLTANNELAAYSTSGSEDQPEGRVNAVYLASYNSRTKTWQSWPDEKARNQLDLWGYALVTGSPGSYRVTECNDRDSCVQRFQGALVSQGYAGWDSTRMTEIDSQWDTARRALEQADADAVTRKQAAGLHAKAIATLPADKLFAYGSRQEQERNYDFALDAYRTIVEKYSKSKLMDAAVARMATVQDKLDQKNAQADNAQAQANAAAQRTASNNQRQQAQSQAQAQRMEEDRQRRQVAYDQCKSTADQCTTDCLTTAGAGVIGGIAGLVNRNAVNTNGLNMINQRAQNTCSRCEAMTKQCETMKPTT